MNLTFRNAFKNKIFYQVALSSILSVTLFSQMAWAMNRSHPIEAFPTSDECKKELKQIDKYLEKLESFFDNVFEGKIIKFKDETTPSDLLKFFSDETGQGVNFLDDFFEKSDFTKKSYFVKESGVKSCENCYEDCKISGKTAAFYLKNIISMYNHGTYLTIFDYSFKSRLIEANNDKKKAWSLFSQDFKNAMYNRFYFYKEDLERLDKQQTSDMF